MAGIFYLPRLFVYHAMCEPSDKIGSERFKVMERKLFFGIMTPGALLTLSFGAALLYSYGWDYLATQRWMHYKLFLVALLCAYHISCYFILKSFKEDSNTRSHIFFRIYNEIPVFLLFGIVILVVVKPF